MEADEYKSWIQNPHIISKTVLEDSLEVLWRHNAPEFKITEEAMKIGGLEKPLKHESPNECDSYLVQHTKEVADNIVE